MDESPLSIKFRVEIWNDQLRLDVTRFIASRLGYYALRLSQVRILQFQTPQLINPVPSSLFAINENDPSQLYNNEQFLWFRIVCSSPTNAAQVLNEIKSKPYMLLSRLKIRYFLPSSDFLENREFPIKMEHITGGQFVKQLIQRYPNTSRTVVLGPDRPDGGVRYDEILNQSRKAILGPFSEDKFVLTADSEFQLKEFLDIDITNLVTFQYQYQYYSNRVRSYTFDNLYWEEEKFRPDFVAEKLNIIYNNSDGYWKDRMVQVFNNARLHKSTFDYVNSPWLIEFQRMMDEGPPSLEKLEILFWKVERLVIYWSYLVGAILRFLVRSFRWMEIDLPRMTNPATYNGLKLNATFRGIVTIQVYLSAITTTTDLTYLVDQVPIQEETNKSKTNLIS